MSLLTLLTGLVGIGAKASSLTAIAGNTSSELAGQLLGLANEEGRALARRHPWAILTAEKTFTTTAAAAQTGAIPSDFDRFIDETMWNRTRRRPVCGPITADEWQNLQANAAASMDYQFRRRGSALLFTPTPAAGETIAYEYVKNTWCTSADGATARTAFAADDDVGLLDEALIALGVKWRFLAGNGLDHETALREYERQVVDAINRDGGRRTISTDPRNARLPIVGRRQQITGIFGVQPSAGDLVGEF